MFDAIVFVMRTTLDIDEDILAAAKQLAEQRRVSMGKVVSELARRGLAPPSSGDTVRSGVRVLPARPGEGRAGLDEVNRLRDDA